MEFYINDCTVYFTAIVEYKRNRALIFLTEMKKLCVFTQGCVQMPLFLPCNTVEVEAEMVCASDLRALCNSQEPGHVYKNKSNARADTRPAPIALSPAAVNKATLLLHCTTLHTYVRIGHERPRSAARSMGHSVTSCNLTMNLVDFIKKKTDFLIGRC